MTQKTVLVVDDERPIVTLLERLARGLGVQTETAYNGKDALEKIRKHKPDLVLLDLIMPIMSGEEVLAVMETDPALKDIPIIVISTKAVVGAGVEREVTLVRKPFEPSEIKRLMRELLGLDDGVARDA